MSGHDLGDNFASLSDAEIQVLHEIVQLASEKPEPAFGPGLFNAYDEVIARQTTPSTQSSRYFAFICRMLAGRKQHETALERFAGLLAEHGITVEPYEDEAGSTEFMQQDDMEQDPQLSFDRDRLGSRDGGNGVLSSAETLAGDEDAPRVLQKRMSSHRDQAPITYPKPFRRATRRSQSEDTHMRGVPGLDRGRLNVRHASHQLSSRRGRRNASVSSTRSLRIQRLQHEPPNEGDAYSADESDSHQATESRRHSFSQAASLLPALGLQDARSFLFAELFQRSEEQLEAMADTFQETKDRVVQRRIISRWKDMASQSNTINHQLRLEAQQVDGLRKLRWVWSTWRRKIDHHRLEREIEEKRTHYTHLEQAAMQAHDDNLKWIALSHMRILADEERQRTAVAKRHIMRKRYFAAWNTVTAANQRKVREFMLGRFFTKWQQRKQHMQTHFALARSTHETNLVRRTYKTWLYAFLDKTAPEFHDRKLERQFFTNWSRKLHRVVNKENEAENHFERRIWASHLSSWQAKARDIMDMNRAAESLRKKNLLKPILTTWKSTALLAPIAVQVSDRVRTRTMRKPFSTWHTQTLQSCQAARVDRLRILRNAFTGWNDQVRIGFLQGQIVFRLKNEALSKWRIATRSSAAQRDHDRTLAHNALQHWLSKAQTRHRSIEGGEMTFQVSKRRRALQGALGNFVLAHQHQQNLEKEARRFRQVRLLYGALAKWRQRSDDVDLLRRKANAADFYILTTKTLKIWSLSIEENRKQRKREAYTYVRRLCKLNLAREMSRRMQIQLAHVRNLDHHAMEFQEDQLMKSTASKLRSWKQRAVTHIGQEIQAKEHYDRRLTAAVLLKMNRHQIHLQAMDVQARELAASSAGVEAMNCLRKLDRRLFQLKGQEQWAVALREKHAEKHVKNMLRYWLELTAAARRRRSDPGREQEFFRSSTMTQPALGDLTVFDTTAWNLEPLDLDLNAFTDTAQAEVEATFVDNDGIITSTPLPGYLRTPSKRTTVRAKARERLAAGGPSTTARTIRFADQVPATAPPRQQSSSAPPALPSPAGPSITPFERKLREQGLTSPSRSGRRTVFLPVGRSPGGLRASTGTRRLGGATPGKSTFAGFEDIPEISEDRSRAF